MQDPTPADSDLTEELARLRAECGALRAERDDLRRELSDVRAERAQRPTSQAGKALGDLFRFAYENPSPVLTFASDGSLLFANPAAASIAEEWDAQGRPQAIGDALADGRTRTAEIEWRGRTIAFKIVPAAEGGYANVYGTDVTAHKQAEQLVAEIEAQRTLLDAIIEHLPVGIGIAEAPSGRLLRTNEQTRRIWRLDAVESPDVAGYAKYTAFHPDGREYAPEDWQGARALKGEDIHGEELEIVRGDGTRGYMRSSAAPVRDREGKIVAAVVSIEDITEHKRADFQREAALADREVALKALRASQEQLELVAQDADRRAAELEAVLAALPVSVTIYGPQAEILRTNGITRELFGLSPAYEEAPVETRLRSSRATWPDGRPVAKEESAVVRALNGEPVRNDIMAVYPADCDVPMWVSTSAATLRGPSGDITGAVVSSADVTELHAAQERLRAANEQLQATQQEVRDANDQLRLRAEQMRTAQEMAEERAAELDATFAVIPHSLVVFEPDGRIRRSNQAARELLGVTPEYEQTPVEERLASRAYADAGGRPLPLDEMPLGRALHGEIVADQIVSLRMAPGGPLTWLSASAAPLRSTPGGEIVGVVTATTDITALRTAQEELQAANLELQVRAEQMRVAEEQARLRAAELDAAFAAIPAGVVIYNRQGDIVRLNQRAEAIISPSPGYAQASRDRRRQTAPMVWPDERPVEASDRPMDRALRGETVRDVTLGVYFGPTLTWLSVGAAPIYGPAGHLLGAVSSFVDITPLHEAQARLEAANDELEAKADELRVQAEQLQARNVELVQMSAEMEAQRAQLEAILQQMPAGLSVAEAPSGKIILGSEQTHRIFGRPLPQAGVVPGYRATRGYHPDGRPYRPEEWPLARALSSGEIVRDEEMVIDRADGSRATLMVSAAPVRGPDGLITAAVSTYLDVTERKATEEALRRSEERYRAFIEHSTEAIWRLELDDPIAVDLPEHEQLRRLYQDGYVAECNEAMARLHEFDSAREAIGVRLGQILPRLSPGNEKALRGLIRCAYHVDAVESMELSRQGGIRHFHNSLIGIVEDDRLIRLWAIQRDITERKAIEAEREAALAALRTARDELEQRVQERTAELARTNRELQAREEEARRQAEHAQALTSVVARLSASLDLRAVLQIVCEETARVLHVPAVSAAVYGAHGDEYDGRFYLGLPETLTDCLTPGPRAYYDDMLNKLGPILVVEDMHSLPASASVDLMVEHGVRGLIGCTILLGDRPLGGLTVYVFDETRRFTSDELALLRGLADQAALAIANARLYKQLGEARDELEERVQERARELGTVLDLSSHITSNLALEPMLATFASSLRSLVDYRSLTIYRIEGETLAAVGYMGPGDRAEALRARAPLERSGGLVEVLAERRPLIAADLAGETAPAPDWQAASHPSLPSQAGRVRSWLGVPLMVRDRPIGVAALTHDEPGHFTARDAELALAYANHAAVAMENARLYDQAKELAAAHERQRLARDLHDAVSQTLFSASLTADVLPKLYARDPIEGQKLLDELRRMNRGALAELRALLVELRPQALNEADLGTLLSQLGEAAAGRSEARITVTRESVCPLLPDVQVALYRIAQEALNNVAKHAKASQATVRLACTPGPDGQARRVELSIADDGIGFNPEQVAADSFGLSIMRERAAAIGAALAIDSGAGGAGGTTVAVIWPGEGQAQ